MITAIITSIGFLIVLVTKSPKLPWVGFSIIVLLSFSMARIIAIENDAPFIPQYLEAIITQIIAVGFSIYGKRLDNEK